MFAFPCIQMFKVVGWRVMVTGVGVYGGLYGYERLCWTARAKERTFKEQVVRISALVTLV